MLKCIEIPIKEGISVLISISNPKVDVKTKNRVSPTSQTG